MQVLDTTGLQCPLPILKAHKLLRHSAPGNEMQLISSDEASLKEVPLFCEQAGYTLVETLKNGQIFTFLIRK